MYIVSSIIWEHKKHLLLFPEKNYFFLLFIFFWSSWEPNHIKQQKPNRIYVYLNQSARGQLYSSKADQDQGA